MIISVEEFLSLRKELPVVDVRSEGEFAEGHIPQAINIPILNNAERVEVGTDYKQKGQAEAIKTGFKLVGPRIVELIENASQVANGKELLVHCWRGGMRSSNFCQFVGMAKIKSYQLTGGYKAYRQTALETFSRPYHFQILGGFTGSGKSEVLRALKSQGAQVIDLEGLANHKGSVFGGLNMPAQPTTEQFQNFLFEELRVLDPSKPIWLEDESITIGKIVLPDPFWRQMCMGKIYTLHLDRASRLNRLVNEYGNADPEEFIGVMSGITKKLGGQHYTAARECIIKNDWSGAIDILLNYYDKAYTTGLSKKTDRVAATVSWDGKNAKALADQLLLLSH